MNQNESTDVLVIGGGTAGFGAAVAAGRAGFKVILLEATSKIGGVMAFCPGMPWGAGTVGYGLTPTYCAPLP